MIYLSMPRYDYRCTQCGMSMEFERGFHEETEPLCCEQVMQRQWGGSVGVIFNGSGFYSTDNRK
jgi:putative FmdB family regulatory protein